jgi:hypothetical protein
VVASIEAGTREVHFGELILAGAALDLTMSDWLQGDGFVKVAGDTEVTLPTLRAGLRGRAGRNELIHEARGSLKRHLTPESAESQFKAAGAIGELEYRVGRQLGEVPVIIATYSKRMYGHWLWQERDARVKERYEADLSPRSLQAVRGHITRELTDELYARISEDQATAEAAIPDIEIDPEWEL